MSEPDVDLDVTLTDAAYERLAKEARRRGVTCDVILEELIMKHVPLPLTAPISASIEDATLKIRIDLERIESDVAACMFDGELTPNIKEQLAKAFEKLAEVLKKTP